MAANPPPAGCRGTGLRLVVTAHLLLWRLPQHHRLGAPPHVPAYAELVRERLPGRVLPCDLGGPETPPLLTAGHGRPPPAATRPRASRRARGVRCQGRGGRCAPGRGGPPRRRLPTGRR